MKISIAQLNPVVGDIDGNLKKLVDYLERASQEASDLLVLPELFLVGYPPRDLLERTWFIEKTETALQTIIGISE
ncbi:MAG: NAD+ synthase, partial [Syntrophomonadaceae bacterium]|nr:NAD+ synthase [Syntrophomonadaceae bacterium]